MRITDRQTEEHDAELTHREPERDPYAGVDDRYQLLTEEPDMSFEARAERLQRRIDEWNGTKSKEEV